MIGGMSPALLLVILVAALIALIPVWRLRVAGWPPRWLFLAWAAYALSIFLAVRAPLAMRVLVPILVVAYVAPFVAGPERLARVLRGRGERPRPIIDVTPVPPAGLPSPRPDEPEAPADRDGDPDDDAPGTGL